MRTDHRAGGTLADRLRSGPLGRDELEQLARDLLGMLISLHAEGRLHRDLNPDSVRLDGAGRLHSSKIGAQRAPGTVPLGPTGPQNYLAPEVLAGGTSDVGSDLFACGVLLGDAAGPDASAPVLVLIGMLTASEPDLRPASAAEALALLGGTTPAPVQPPVQPMAPPAPRAPIPAPAPGFRQSFEKPAVAASPPPPVPAAPPVPVSPPQDVPTQAVEFPPVQHFPPAEPPPVMPVPAVAEAPQVAELPPAAYPRLRRRPSRRVVLSVAAAVAGLAIVATGAAVLGGDGAAEPTIPAPVDAPLDQQLDDLDSAIDLVTK